MFEWSSNRSRQRRYSIRRNFTTERYKYLTIPPSSSIASKPSLSQYNLFPQANKTPTTTIIMRFLLSTLLFLTTTTLVSAICETGTGNVEVCCGDADPGCESSSNCMLRCNPNGLPGEGGVLGCIAGKFRISHLCKSPPPLPLCEREAGCDVG